MRKTKTECFVPKSSRHTQTKRPRSSRHLTVAMAPVFDGLPEECLALILSFTSPRDVCRFSAVSRAFRAAARCDIAWAKFLPPDLDGVLSRAPSSSVEPSSPGKRDLFFRLCDNPVLIDGGLKSFSLQRWSGKKCVMLGARSLSIVWGDTPEYWRWSTFYRSRFSEVAELRRVVWLEVQGKIETRLLSSRTEYGAYFVFKFVQGHDGFENLPVVTQCSGEKSVVFFDPDGSLRRKYQIAQEKLPYILAGIESGRISRANIWKGRDKRLPREREDGWAEVELGRFFTRKGEDGEVKVSLMELTNKGKSGLIIQGIEFRPKQKI